MVFNARWRPVQGMIRRLLQLYLGLAAYGFAIALTVRAELGLSPWDVFHQGLSRVTPLSHGLIVNLVGLGLLLLWIPLRIRPGLGTISNVLVIGTAADLALAILPNVETLALRWLMVASAVIIIGLASGAYISANFDPGPRDGLMTGLVARTGWSVRRVRAAIELTVLGGGWALGGIVGPGTLLYALAIGTAVHMALGLFNRTPKDAPHFSADVTP
jgi:uncharacterized membrane protein YczE